MVKILICNNNLQNNNIKVLYKINYRTKDLYIYDNILNTFIYYKYTFKNKYTNKGYVNYIEISLNVINFYPYYKYMNNKNVKQIKKLILKKWNNPIHLLIDLYEYSANVFILYTKSYNLKMESYIYYYDKRKLNKWY